MLSPRFVGADVPKLQQQPGGALPPVPIPGTAGLQMAGDQFQRSAQYIQESNAANSQIVGQIGEAQAAYRRAIGARDSADLLRPRGDDLGGFVAGLGSIAEYLIKKEEAKQEAARQQAWIQANQAVEDLVSRSEDIVRGPTGYPGWENAYNTIMMQYGGILDADQIVQLTRRAYDGAQPVLSRQAQEMRDYAQTQIQNRRATSATQVTLVLSQHLARLQNPTSPEEFQQTAAEAQQILFQELAGMPVADQQFVLNQVLSQISDSALDGNVLLQGEYSRLTQVSEFLTGYQALQEEFYATGDITAFNVGLYTLVNQYPEARPLVDQLANPNEQQELEYRRWSWTNTMAQQQQQTFEQARQYVTLSSTQEQAIALMVYARPADRALWEQFRDIPQVARALEAADYRAEYDVRTRELQVRQADYNRAISALQAQDIRVQIGFISNQENLSNLEQLLGLSGEVSERLETAGGLLGTGLGQYIEQYQILIGQPQTPQTQEALRQLNNQLTQTFGQIAQEIQTSYNSYVDEYNRWAERHVFNSYPGTGWGNPTEEAALLETLPAEVDRIQQEINRQQRDYATSMTPEYLNPIRPQLAELPPLAEVQSGGQPRLIPVPPGGDYVVTSLLGDGRNHAGIDIDMPVGTPVVAYVEGTVRIRREEDDGRSYGLYVDILDDEGYLHRFAHLDATNVRDGQRVRIGDILAYSGNSGTSTAPHLHWEVRVPGGAEYGSAGIMDPFEFMSGIPQGPGRQVRQGDENPRTIPPDAVNLGNGMFIVRDMIVGPDGRMQPAAYTPQNPIRNVYTPSTREDYGDIRNEPSNNYGYSVLAEDRSYRIALARTASNLGIPAIWLADIIAFESGHQPSISNRRNNSYTGLIQFGDEAARNLGTTRAALSRMSRAEQMVYVERYLQEYVDRFGGFRDIFEVLAAIWGGPRLVNQYRREPTSRTTRNWSDGDITFDGYTRRLGEAAGRRYQRLWDPEPTIHTQYHSNCAMCQSFRRSNSSIIPHEAS